MANKKNTKKQMNNGMNAHPLTMFVKKIAHESMGGMMVTDTNFPKAMNLFGEDRFEKSSKEVTEFVYNTMKNKYFVTPDPMSHPMFMNCLLAKSICEGLVDTTTDQERINKSFLAAAIESAKMWGAL